MQWYNHFRRLLPMRYRSAVKSPSFSGCPADRRSPCVFCYLPPVPDVQTEDGKGLCHCLRHNRGCQESLIQHRQMSVNVLFLNLIDDKPFDTRFVMFIPLRIPPCVSTDTHIKRHCVRNPGCSGTRNTSILPSAVPLRNPYLSRPYNIHTDW